MAINLFECSGGRVVLPDGALVLVDREDGGNLIVNPPREIWDRGELSRNELSAWSFLVAATATAMLETLPQLDGGCINYWDAGNWALNEAAEPRGPKYGRRHRRVHLHLLGRGRNSTDPSWQWGEAPIFPTFAERHAWAAPHRRVTPEECRLIVPRVEALLTSRYELQRSELTPWSVCRRCGYPTIGAESICEECGR